MSSPSSEEKHYYIYYDNGFVSMPPQRLKIVFGTKQHACSEMQKHVATMNRGVEKTDDHFLRADDNGGCASRDGRRVYMFELVDDGIDACHGYVNVDDENTKLKEQNKELQEENQKLRTYAIQMLDVLGDVDLAYHGNAQELYEEVSRFMGRWE